jgi:hypothetical protein
MLLIWAWFFLWMHAACAFSRRRLDYCPCMGVAGGSGVR